LNGDYLIEQLKFDIASHDDAFFYTATCKRA
ncbi:baseplate hub protein, partial [Xenorhabdus bovienii]